MIPNPISPCHLNPRKLLRLQISIWYLRVNKLKLNADYIEVLLVNQKVDQGTGIQCYTPPGNSGNKLQINFTLADYWFVAIFEMLSLPICVVKSELTYSDLNKVFKVSEIF